MTFIRPAGAWRLIERREILAAVTTTNFTGLNGELDGVYKIIARWVNGSGISSTFTLEPNGIATNQEGRAVKGEFISGPTVNVVTTLNLASIQGSEFGMSEHHFYARRVEGGVAQNRYLLGRSVETRPTATDVFAEWNHVAWLETVTDITSLLIRASQASGIGIGTTISLYKQGS